ncbi:pentapeptide repeat-containing protein [Nocardia sp. NPDC049149]|uniref:pentapeptide repeat-containing protein n=1 Tax=Nocardia sp. NPDC049149 TaxID=3364315 RepID=UPI0037211F9A
MEGANFFKAKFGGSAQFDGATFSNDTGFTSATFEGDTWFQGVTFEGSPQRLSGLVWDAQVAGYRGGTGTAEASTVWVCRCGYGMLHGGRSTRSATVPC